MALVSLRSVEAVNLVAILMLASRKVSSRVAVLTYYPNRHRYRSKIW